MKYAGLTVKQIEQFCNKGTIMGLGGMSFKGQGPTIMRALLEALKEKDELFMKYGGHKAACGYVYLKLGKDICICGFQKELDKINA